MKFTILIIDDEENIRNGLETNFEMEDYNVKTASNGKDGLRERHWYPLRLSQKIPFFL